MRASRSLGTLPWLLLATLLLAAQLANAKTYILPADFGQSGTPFEECTPSPPYVCQKVTLDKPGDKTVVTSNVDFTVEQSFQIEKNQRFNQECYAVNITALDNFVLKKNVFFVGNVTATKEVKLEERAEMNGDATSLEPKIQLESGAVINGTCDPVSAIEGTGSCGGVSQCTQVLPPVLEITKTAAVSVAQPDDEVIYTLALTNTGGSATENSTVTDVVPANMTFVSASSEGIYDPGTRTVTWEGELDPEEESQLTLVLRVDAGTPDGTVITNTASLDADNVAEPVESDFDIVIDASPVLTLTKEANLDQVEVGETITYTFTITNSGNAIATNLVLTDTLSPFVEFVSETGGGAEGPAGVVTWTAAEIQVGATAQVTLTVRVIADPGGDPALVVNNASLDSDETTPVVAGASVVVQAEPIFTLTKLADKEVVDAGENITYTLDFVNIGNAAEANPLLVDTLPQDMTFVSATAGGEETAQGSGIIEWDIDDLGILNPGDSSSVQVTARVNKPLANDTRLINRAALFYGIDDEVDADFTTVVSSRPIILLAKQGNKTIANPGDEITYFIEAVNVGNDVATDLVLVDSLPEDVTFVGASDGGTESGGVVSWPIEQLNINRPQIFVIDALIDPVLPDQTKLINTATIVGDETSVSAEFETTVRSEAVLEITKTAINGETILPLDVVVPGQEITYVITLRNTGNAIAENVVVEDPIPQFTDYVAGTARPQALLVGESLRWTRDSLAPGQVDIFTFTARVDSVLADGTPIYNVATGDADLTRAAVADSLLFVDSSPVLSLTKIVEQSSAQPGDLLNYRLQVANTGNANAINAILEDTLPENTTFESATGDFQVVGNQVVWQVDQLNAGASGEVTLTVRLDPVIPSGTTIRNSASLDADNAPPVTAEVTTQIESAPLLEIDKISDADVVEPGDQLTYLLTVDNIGNAVADNVQVSDRIPQNTTFVSASPGGVLSGDEVIWSLGELSPGPSAQVSMTVLVDTPLDDGTELSNDALARADNAELVGESVTVRVASSPVLTLLKDVDKSVIEPGDEITYRLTVGNEGNAIARNPVLAEVVPRNTTLVAAPGATVNGRLLTWTTDTLSPGQVAEVTATVRADAVLDDGTAIRNLAVVDAENATAEFAIKRTDVDSSPVLSVTKVPSVPVVDPGQRYTYTLDYANTGNADANGVVLADSVPGNTSFVSATDGGVVENGNVVWRFAEVAAGTSGQVTATFDVAPPPLANGTPISNVVTLSADNALSASTEAQVTVDSAPRLELTKISDKSIATPGEEITYELTLTNNGNATADTVTIEDFVPENTTFISASSGGTPDGKVIRWTFPELGIDSLIVVMKVRVDSPLSNGTLIENRAVADAENAASVSATADTLIASAPNLELNKRAARELASPGDEISFVISVGNTGTDVARNVVLTDPIPAGTSFVSASAGGTLVDGQVVWSLGDLPAGPSADLTLKLRVASPLDNGTVINNTVFMTDDDGSLLADSDAVLIESAPILQLNKSASARLVSPGGELIYTLRIRNTGNAIANEVTLQDNLPQNTEFVAASAGGVERDGVVSWTLGAVAPGSEPEVTLTVRVDTPLDNDTVLANTALVTASNAPGNAALAVSVVDSAPLLTLDKSSDVSLVQPGDLVTYRFAYSNDGNANAANAELIDVIPETLTFESASAGGVRLGDEVRWDLGAITAGTGGEVTATFSVNGPSLPDGTVISNSATLSADDTTPASDTEQVTARTAPVLEVSKTADKPVVEPGEQLTYTISVQNFGNDTATGVTLVDQLPDNATLVFAGSTATLSGDTVQWAIGDLPVGASASVLLIVEVDSPQAVGSSVLNTVTANSVEVPPTVAVSDVPVDSAPVLVVTKTPRVSVVSPGDLITFDLNFANAGNAPAEETSLEDTLPAGTSFVSASDGGQFANGRVTWSFGQLIAGSTGTVELTVRADFGLSNGDSLLNSATLSASNAPPDSTSAAVLVSATPVLSITKSADVTTGQPGDPIQYTLTYRNDGNAAASNVVISDRVPDNADFVSAPEGSLSGGVVTWNIGGVPVGAGGTLTLSVEISGSAEEGDRVVNRASIVSDETAPSVSNDVIVSVSDTPNLELAIVGSPETVVPDETITYTVSYSNLSGGTALEPIIAGVLPEGTSFLGASSGGVLKQRGDLQYVEWTLPDLAAGDGGFVTFNVAFTDKGAAQRLLAAGGQDVVPAQRSLDPSLRPAAAEVQTMAAQVDQQGADTVKLLTAYAAIAASNASPPQVESAQTLVIINNVPALRPKVVPTSSRTLLIVLALLILALSRSQLVSGRRG